MMYALWVGLLCLGLLFGYGLYELHKRIVALQGQLVKQQEQHTKQLKMLARRLDSYLTGTMTMGQELHALREQVEPLPDKILQMQQRDPSSLSFIEAARLISLGASTEDLQQACGLTHAEAELLQIMHKRQP